MKISKTIETLRDPFYHLYLEGRKEKRSCINLPMFIRTSLEKVATKMFLSLHMTATGGWIPSSSVKVGCSNSCVGGWRVSWKKENGKKEKING